MTADENVYVSVNERTGEEGWGREINTSEKQVH